MPWDPGKYNQFKAIRYQPFYDLAALISPSHLETAVDIGCGTGEQTSILAEQFPSAHFLGIDASPDMLSKSAAFAGDRVRFLQSTVEDFISSRRDQQWDLVFSNAALQWSDDHPSLFPRLIRLLRNGGQLAIQMPVQQENRLNQLLHELVSEEPFAGYLQGWRRESPVLSIDQYAQLFFENGLSDLQLMLKVYPIIADNARQLFDFISGSALIPYLERLTETQKNDFTEAYLDRIQAAFGKFPSLYAFKRLLLYGRKTGSTA